MIITVKTIPNSSRDRFEKISDGNYKVHVTAVPDNGRANAALLRILSKELGINANRIKILTPTSRTKKIAIKDVNA